MLFWREVYILLYRRRKAGAASHRYAVRAVTRSSWPIGGAQAYAFGTTGTYYFGYCTMTPM